MPTVMFWPVVFYANLCSIAEKYNWSQLHINPVCSVMKNLAVLSPLGGIKSHTLFKDDIIRGDRLKIIKRNLELDLDCLLIWYL